MFTGMGWMSRNFGVAFRDWTIEYYVSRASGDTLRDQFRNHNQMLNRQIHNLSRTDWSQCNYRLKSVLR